MATKTSPTKLREGIRNQIVKAIFDYVHDEIDESADFVADNAFMLPVVDAENGEWYAKVTVSIPIGENHGAIPYDGFAEAEAYKREKEAKAEKARVKAEEKARKIERDRKAREAKAKAKADREANTEKTSVGDVMAKKMKQMIK